MSIFFKWRPEGHMYGYSTLESIFMALIAVITNLAFILPLLVFIHRRMIILTCLIIFVIIISLFYHITESIGASILLLTYQNWLILDNFGAVVSVISIMIYISNLKQPELELYLNISALLFGVVTQLAFRLFYLCYIVPIGVFSILIIVLICIYKPKFFTNRRMTIKGLTCFAIGLVFFILSLVLRFQDYLRIMHGLWHVFVALSCFYLSQSFEDDPDKLYFIFRSRKGNQQSTNEVPKQEQSDNPNQTPINDPENQTPQTNQGNQDIIIIEKI